MSDLFFKTREETKAWLDDVGVKRYSIQGDLTVDVTGPVNLTAKGLTRIPVQFGVVTGGFKCNNNQLTTLAGSPTSCVNFDCDCNNLTDLTGAPDLCVFFRCDNNQLTNLIGGPRECERFSCDNNQLTDLGGSGQYKKLWCSSNHLTSLDGVSASCEMVCCYENPYLFDISAAASGCEVDCDFDMVTENQAARQLSMLDANSGAFDTLLRSKPGRLL